MYAQERSFEHTSFENCAPPQLLQRILFFIYYNVLVSFLAVKNRLQFSFHSRQQAKAMPTPNSSLDSATLVRLSVYTPTQGVGLIVRDRDDSRVSQTKFNSIFAFFVGISKEQDIMSGAKIRTSITLTKSDLQSLEKLQEHFDAQSVSETIRRSLSQSSLLKRYADEHGDVTVESAGKRIVVPSRS